MKFVQLFTLDKQKTDDLFEYSGPRFVNLYIIYHHS